jgi:hypothetical protein
VFAAFLDALRYPGSYDLFEHAGELFIVPVGEGRRPDVPLLNPCSASHSAFCESVRERRIEPAHAPSSQRKKPNSMSRMITDSGTPSSQRRIGMGTLNVGVGTKRRLASLRY